VKKARQNPGKDGLIKQS